MGEELAPPPGQGQDLEGLGPGTAELLIDNCILLPVQCWAGLGQAVGQTLRPQVRDQTVQTGVAHRQRAAINHRIGPACALEQLATGADIDHRVQPRRWAVTVGFEHRRAQALQRSRADEAGHG
jgi:hypothetical protein